MRIPSELGGGYFGLDVDFGGLGESDCLFNASIVSYFFGVFFFGSGDGDGESAFLYGCCVGEGD